MFDSLIFLSVVAVHLGLVGDDWVLVWLLWCRNNSYRDSLTLLIDFMPYRRQTNSSMTSATLSDTVGNSPSKENAGIYLLSDFIKSWHLTFPLPTKQLVESHPVNACKPGRAHFTSSSISFSFISRYRMDPPLPSCR